MKSQTQRTYEPPDRKVRDHFPYYRWMRAEGIPIAYGVAGMSDITAIPRKPWARTGRGLGTFIELTGTYQAERGLFVCEIPPGQSLDVQHHLYEQFTLILQGTGAAEIWQTNGSKRTVEWSKGSLFAPPRNTYYRMFNLGQEPVLYFGVTNAPRVLNALFPATGANDTDPGRAGQFDYIFNSLYDFLDLYDGSEDYFSRLDNRTTAGGYRAAVWTTNFIPNVNEALVDEYDHKVAGGRVTVYHMAGGFPMGHVGEWPVGRYHKAHYHGPGAVLVGLKGKGYVNLWPHEIGIHPWRDGHADQVEMVEWGVNSIYSPPDGYWHQHMSTGKVPARHVAVYGGNIPLMTHGASEAYGEGDLNIPYSEGGRLLDYEDEDPEVRRYFIAANRREGVECTMPSVTYRESRG
ncbi:MAG TPA: hypothetical protein VGK54_14540 [Chloroflexota bacterium]